MARKLESLLHNLPPAKFMRAMRAAIEGIDRGERAFIHGPMRPRPSTGQAPRRRVPRTATDEGRDSAKASTSAGSLCVHSQPFLEKNLTRSPCLAIRNR
jgi:hypothetical protein